jgi:type I restriction enzyme, R subunit
MPETPEHKARREIDAKLLASGWLVQNRDDLDLTAGRGIAVREFPMKSGFGFADYLLYLDRRAVGAVEAKAEGTLTGVEAQSAKYAAGLPDNLPAHRRPLPFLFESNGSVTFFTNGLDPKPRSHKVFSFPRPETFAEWLTQLYQLRGRLTQLPPLDESGFWKVQTQAITNLEASLAKADPRALIQMATGSGKTYTAVSSAYRLLKFCGAKRILFLVDRGNLGKQAEDEFANYTPPDDTRKFPTLYTVQRLKTNSINPAAKVVITTIQRLYSMLKGEAEFDAENEEGSGFDSAKPWKGEPPDVVYNGGIPPEFFDFIIVDECHRSIYELWAQVLLYFDSFLIGLTATPAGRTIGFFNQNLVMQYGHDEAVIGVGVVFGKDEGLGNFLSVGKSIGQDLVAELPKDGANLALGDDIAVEIVGRVGKVLLEALQSLGAGELVTLVHVDAGIIGDDGRASFGDAGADAINVEVHIDVVGREPPLPGIAAMSILSRCCRITCRGVPVLP